MKTYNSFIAEQKEKEPRGKYYSGIDSDSTKEKRQDHFERGKKMDDDNPEAYKKAPGDATAKTKESKHTKKYREMFGEDAVEDFSIEERVGAENLFSLMFPKLDKLIDKILKKDTYKKAVRYYLSLNQKNDLTPKENLVRAAKDTHLDPRILKRTIKDVAKKIDIPSYLVLESELDFLEEDTQVLEENDKGLDKKASDSGISKSILKQVYNRGVAAWRTGHRPGTTPEQWGMARVNSFITGGKTRTTADADLWKKHKGKS